MTGREVGNAASAPNVRREHEPLPLEELEWPGRAGLRLGWTLADTRVPARTARQAAEMLAAIRSLRAVVLRQVHSDRICLIDSQRGPGVALDPVGDGMITDRTDLLIGVSAADCAPLFLFADAWTAILHAGWRGVVQGILPHALELLQLRTGLGIEQMRLAIGPCIGPCCFEVSPAVASLFPASVRRLHGQRRTVDIPGAVIDQWLRCGGGMASLMRLDRCTVCSRPLMHSHRRDPGPGRNLAYLYHTPG